MTTWMTFLTISSKCTMIWRISNYFPLIPVLFNLSQFNNDNPKCNKSANNYLFVILHNSQNWFESVQNAHCGNRPVFRSLFGAQKLCEDIGLKSTNQTTICNRFNTTETYIALSKRYSYWSKNFQWFRTLIELERIDNAIQNIFIPVPVILGRRSESLHSYTSQSIYP